MPGIIITRGRSGARKPDAGFRAIIEEKNMSGQDKVSLVQEVYEDFGKGDIQALLALCTDDIEWVHPSLENLPVTGTWHGREQVGEFFKALSETQEPQQFQPHEYITQDDKVVVLGRYAWRQKATGSDFESDWVHVFTIRDGKLENFREYSDIHMAPTPFQQHQTQRMERESSSPSPGLH
jgi:ketosteroid isomerase-like protein